MGDDAVDGPEAIENAPIPGALANVSSGLVRAVVSRPDGLVREVKTKTVVSREEIDERLETEDVKFLGDFSDEVSLLIFRFFYYFFISLECIEWNQSNKRQTHSNVEQLNHIENNNQVITHKPQTKNNFTVFFVQ